MNHLPARLLHRAERDEISPRMVPGLLGKLGKWLLAGRDQPFRYAPRISILTAPEQASRVAEQELDVTFLNRRRPALSALVVEAFTGNDTSPQPLLVAQVDRSCTEDQTDYANCG